MYARFSCQSFTKKMQLLSHRLQSKSILFPPLFAAIGILSLYMPIICEEEVKEGKKLRTQESKGLNTGRNEVSKRKKTRHPDLR